MTGLIAQRIDRIREQIPEHVRLIAVTKQVSPEAIREAYEAGVRDFAENRLQEALFKQQQLQDLPDICWHFIGHLQANKAKKVLESFQWIHSVDSLKLARRLDRLAEELSCRPQVCLQVKVVPDPNKYGWRIPALLADLPELDKCHNLGIRGLMTILPLGLSASQALDAFNATRELADKIGQQNWSNLQMDQLSMGMSADYLLAVKAGATMIRLGTIIFGARS
ncbi:YggS family pyridoxal phosphate-dependent enzyme [Pleurocapsales cyanobacterium LEGE 06147]|nr:YggS family pyridoxal phosphate-dependent enzyme [Pleurocapsales cyanobacterium LEGE 06147]